MRKSSKIPKFKLFGKKVYKNAVLGFILLWRRRFMLEDMPDKVIREVGKLRGKIKRVWTTAGLTNKEKWLLQFLIDWYLLKDVDWENYY